MNKQNRLLSNIKPYLSRFVLALFFMSMVALFTALFALIIRPVMDELFIQGGGYITEKSRSIRDIIIGIFNVRPDNMVVVLPQLLFLCFLGQSVFTFLSLYFMKTLGLKVVKGIRDRLYTNLINQSIDFLSKSKTGDLVSRISNDIEKIKFAVSETLAVYVRETLTLLALLAVIFYQDWYMSLFSFIIIPSATFILIVFGKRVKKRGIQSQEAIGELSNFLTETVTGNRIVKAYNMETYEIQKFSRLNTRHFRINSKIAMIYSLSAPIMNIIGGVVAALIFLIGMKRVAGGYMSPGQFSSFLAALFLMYNPMKRLSQANNDFQQGKAGYERVLQIIENKNPIVDLPGCVDVEKVKGDVEFKNVSFSYDQRVPVIKHVSFKARANEMLALVGSSGSGKTTLMNLFLRFYDVSSGQIEIDGRDIREFSLKSLRQTIGLVTQDVFLFNDSIVNNIAYGKSHYTLDEVRKSAEIARASEFIERLPKGYDTLVGERGVFLSNGQRQRIAIARAILKNPAILFFDEATSSLDSESEKLIQEAMVEVMRNRTTFVIAHRLSTIVEANKIMVIDKGEIKESGNHRELLKKKGLYYSLYNLQFPDMDIIMEK
jgi:subfamily B ATP-binding cassette protein MsbA